MHDPASAELSHPGRAHYISVHPGSATHQPIGHYQIRRGFDDVQRNNAAGGRGRCRHLDPCVPYALRRACGAGPPVAWTITRDTVTVYCPRGRMLLAGPVPARTLVALAERLHFG